MKLMKNLFLFGFLFVLTGCSNDIISERPGDNEETIKEKIANHFDKSGNPFFSIRLTQEEEKVSEGLWNFTMNLLRASLSLNPDDNVLVSPLGAAMVTGMIANGMNREEGEELLNELIRTEDILAMNSYLKKIMTSFPEIDKSSTFNTANLMWLKKPYTLTSEYTSILESVYGASVMSSETWDLSQISLINSWILENTNSYVEVLFDEDENDLDLSELWLNVLYFKGLWSDKFQEESIVKSEFLCGDGTVIKTDMMRKTDNYMSLSDELLFEVSGVPVSILSDDQLIQFTMPYGNSAYCFTAVMPPKNNPELDYIFDNFSFNSKVMGVVRDEINDFYENISTNGHLGKSITVPKFKMSMNVDLIPALQVMNSSIPLDKLNHIDLLGISTSDRTESVDIFRQRLEFEIDEEGMELEVVDRGDVSAGIPPSVEFNRPFVYLVWERSTGAVLLAGVYMHP